MKGKFGRRAKRKAEQRTRAGRLADQRRRDELRAKIAAADAEAADLAALAQQVHDRLSELEQRDADAVAELVDRAHELAQAAGELAAENALLRGELREAARQYRQGVGSASDHEMLRREVFDAIVELGGLRARAHKENLHQRFAVRLGWPAARARGAVTNSGAYHADSQGVR